MSDDLIAISPRGVEGDVFVVKNGKVASCPEDPRTCLEKIYCMCGVVSERPLAIAPNLTQGILCKETESWEPGVEVLQRTNGTSLIVSGLLLNSETEVGLRLNSPSSRHLNPSE